MFENTVCTRAFSLLAAMMAMSAAPRSNADIVLTVDASAGGGQFTATATSANSAASFSGLSGGIRLVDAVIPRQIPTGINLGLCYGAITSGLGAASSMAPFDVSCSREAATRLDFGFNPDAESQTFIAGQPAFTGSFSGALWVGDPGTAAAFFPGGNRTGEIHVLDSLGGDTGIVIGEYQLIGPPAVACCHTGNGTCTVFGELCPPGTVAATPASGSCTPGACPQPPVCCNTTTGACSLGTAIPSACPSGTFVSAGSTSCAPANPCPPPPVCCDDLTGVCSLGTAVPPACPTNTTLITGATTCSPASPCPQPPVCCNNANGACSLGTAIPSGCFFGFSVSAGATSCAPANPCPQPPVCCDTTTGVCSLGTAIPAGCGPGSVETPGATSCVPTNPCPQPPVCCDTFSGACSLGIANPLSCPAGSAIFTGTSCSPTPCPPQPVCCDATTGACSLGMAIPGICGSGSLFLPGPFSCTPVNTCPQPTACCNVITGACTIALPAQTCPALTIAATPAVSTCAPYPCTAVLTSAAAVGLLCTDCTYVNGVFDGRDGQLSHLGGASPHGSKAADDLFLCENFVYDLKTFSATIFTTTFPGLVKPKGEIWSDCGGCPGEKLYEFTNPLVIETGANLPTPAFDGRPLRIVNVTFDVTRETSVPNRNVVLKGGRYWVSIYGTSDNLGPTMQMFDVTYWGTTAPPIKGKPAHKVDGNAGNAYNVFTFPSGCGPGAWHSVADDCCIGCTDLNFSFCATPCKVLVDNGGARVQAGGLANGSTSQFAPASWSAAETRSADDFSVPPCQDYRICYVEACVLTNCPTFDGVFELYSNNCNKPDYALHGAPLLNTQYVATKVIPLGPAYTSTIDGKTVQGYRLEFHDLNITLTGGRQYWISAGVRYTFSINERAFFCYNSYCDARCAIHWNEGRVLTATTLDHEARVAGCVSPAPVVGCNGWAKTGNDMSFLIAADGTTLPGPINGGPGDTTPACRADVNSDGSLTVQDIFDYLNAFFSGCP